MRINMLPAWAQMALKNGPVFGSDPEPTPAGDPPATVTNPPDKKPDSETPVNINPDDFNKAIRDRDSAQAELQALQAEKQQREEAEEQAAAATRSKEENQAKEIGQLKEDNAKLTLVNTENLLKLSIYENKKYSWKDASIVSKLIDRSEIKIDVKSGKVEGVEDALKKLAKDHAYLLAGADDNNSGNGNSGVPNGFPAGAPASGGVPGGGGDSSAKANKRRDMENRFPVLRV